MMNFFRRTPEKPLQPTQQQQQDDYGNQMNNNNIIINKEYSEFFRKPGQTTGGYKRLEKLGGGSFGSVYKAVDPVTNVYYAVKLLNYHTYESNPAAKKYIKAEFDILNKLKDGEQHPHIVNIPDVLDQYTYVFEYCNGDSLQRYFAERAPITENTLKTIFVQLLSALHFLHTRDSPIVHRDLKPANVLVHQNNGRSVFKLTDFGFSKSMTEIEQLASHVGSPLFQAPEIGKIKYDHMVDIFSLGVVFYYIARQRYNDPISCPVLPDHIMALPSSLSMDFKNLLIRMINKDPKQRITIPEIVRTKWILDKFVQLEVPGQDRYLMNLQDLYQIHDKTYRGFIENKFNISLADQLVLVAYHDSDRLYPLENTISRPIYTVDRVFLINKKQEIPRIIFNPIDQVSKFSEIIKKPMVWTIHKYQDEKLADARRVQFIITDLLKKTNDYLRLYTLFRDYYLTQTKTTKFTIALNKIGEFCKSNQDNHKALETVRMLKDLDSNGIETNELFIERLPLIIQTFLSRDNSNLYDNIIKVSKDLESKEKLYVDFTLSISQALTEIDSLAKQFEIVKNGIIQLREPNDSTFGFIFDTDTLMKHFSEYMEKCYKLYIKLYSSHNKELPLFIEHFNQLIKSITSLDTLLNQSQSIMEDQQLINEITKMPAYYKKYQSELKRRAKFQEIYNQETRKLALDMHSLIQSEISLRSLFNNSDPPKYFVPLGLSNQDIENPLHNYLPTAESLSLRDFITSEGFDLIEDHVSSTQNLLPTSFMMDLIKENGELQRRLSEYNKHDAPHQSSSSSSMIDSVVQQSVIYTGPNQNNSPSGNSIGEDKEVNDLKIQLEEMKLTNEQRILDLEQSLKTQSQQKEEIEGLKKSLEGAINNQYEIQLKVVRENNSELLDRIRVLQEERDEKTAKQLQTANEIEMKDKKIAELEKDVIDLREAARILEQN